MLGMEAVSRRCNCCIMNVKLIATGVTYLPERINLVPVLPKAKSIIHERGRTVLCASTRPCRGKLRTLQLFLREFLQNHYLCACVCVRCAFFIMSKWCHLLSSVGSLFGAKQVPPGCDHSQRGVPVISMLTRFCCLNG